jgi:YD repeat-containing protein
MLHSTTSPRFTRIAQVLFVWFVMCSDLRQQQAQAGPDNEISDADRMVLETLRDAHVQFRQRPVSGHIRATRANYSPAPVDELEIDVYWSGDLYKGTVTRQVWHDEAVAKQLGTDLGRWKVIRIAGPDCRIEAQRNLLEPDSPLHISRGDVPSRGSHGDTALEDAWVGTTCTVCCAHMLFAVGSASPCKYGVSPDYQYDDAGNRTVMVEGGGTTRTTWSYDNSNQLTGENRTGTSAQRQTFSYDPAGNRLLKNIDGSRTTYAYDAANQLKYGNATAGRTTYVYDLNGNQQIEQPPAGNRTTTTWNFENQPTLYRLPAGDRVTMAYNGDNRRVEKQEPST